MKHFLIFGCLLVLTACKDNTVAPGFSSNTVNSTSTGNISTVFNPAGQTLLLSGTFASAAHTTEGSVKLYADKDNKRVLVVEGFKTDAGPDLRIYLAENAKAQNFIELSDKVVSKGDFTVTIPTNANLDKQKSLLIWCKQFSVLFGNADLK